MKNALILCSGGLDSVTTAHYVRKKLKYSEIILLFFNYSQRNILGERNAVHKCAKSLNAKVHEINIKEIGSISNSLLNSSRSPSFIKSLNDTSKESSKWYVPARNIVFLSYALSISDSLYSKNKEKCDIFVGFKSEGKESYPDSTLDFINRMDKVSRFSTQSKPKIIAPLIRKDKEDIITLASSLNVSIKETFSCYIGPKNHCGKCLACRLRKAGFYWANIQDDTQYLS